MSRITMQDFEEYDYKLSRSYLSMGKRDDSDSGNAWWREGIFNHPECIGRVYESSTPRFQVTSIFFVLGGRSYHRRWETVWGDKTLARLAREFIEDIISEQ